MALQSEVHTSKTEISKMTMLFFEVGEREFAFVLSHHFLELLEFDNFFQRHRNGLGARFGAQNFAGSIGQLFVQSD